MDVLLTVSLLLTFFVGYRYAVKLTRYLARNGLPPGPGLEWDHGEIYR